VSAAESLELFLQEASDHLQYLREYSGLVQESQARPEDFEKLYIAAHTLCGTSASFGFPLFSEVAGKLAHIFQYAMNARLGPDTHGPLTEFLADAVSVLEFDLLQMANDGTECAPDIAAFKQRYSFAFPAAVEDTATAEEIASQSPQANFATPSSPSSSGVSFVDSLPEDSDIPAEVLEIFVAEAEEHFQTVTECLLALEGNPNAEDINRLFRAMHTVKGSAAQVGVHRCAVVAHRVEELIGRMRDGRLQPSAEIVDLCLDSVDALKKLLHHSWIDDAEMRAKLEPLLARIEEIAPAGTEEPLMDSSEAAPASAAAEQAPATELAPAATQQISAARRPAPATSAAVRAHFTRSPGSHDERRRRTRDQSHADARPSERTGQAGRSLDLFKGAPLAESFRVPG
jgi:chemosensory pili system protein ChpA (sensor histidine kinase/response regulator)